jgi:DNA polymerase I-like protein with 3'-5' exonuclease and polymerase domains
MRKHHVLYNSAPLIKKILETEEASHIPEEMEKGFKVDIHTLIYLGDIFGKIISNLYKEIEGKLGRTVRLNSNRELGDLLFHSLGLPSSIKTPKGEISASLPVLERFRDSYCKIHPEFNQFTCPTGRIYSYIQNLPKKIRKVLVNTKGQIVRIILLSGFRERY